MRYLSQKVANDKMRYKPYQGVRYLAMLYVTLQLAEKLLNKFAYR